LFIPRLGALVPELAVGELEEPDDPELRGVARSPLWRGLLAAAPPRCCGAYSRAPLLPEDGNSAAPDDDDVPLLGLETLPLDAEPAPLAVAEPPAELPPAEPGLGRSTADPVVGLES